MMLPGGASILNTAHRLPGQTGSGAADVSIIFDRSTASDKMKSNRKQIKPRRAAAAEDAAKWREAFVRYLRSECHLAENTVLAYDRDLRRFLEWLGTRRFAGLTISDLAGYPAWLIAQQLAPASVSRHVVSLKVFFRYLQLESVLTENQTELLGTQKLWQRVPTVLSTG